MKSNHYSWGKTAGALSLALLLLLTGCGSVSDHTRETTPSDGSANASTIPVTSVSETATQSEPPVTESEPLTEDAYYQWNPYVFDRLVGEYEADARLLADAILSRADAVTLSDPEFARIVAENIAFEFPPSALAEFTVSEETVHISYLCTAEEQNRQIDAFEYGVNRGLALLTEEDGELQCAILLYDYVVKNVTYFSTDYTDKEITAFSALAAGETICYGFADAFGYLLRQTGMEAHLWRGGTHTLSGFSDHGWCYAKIDGKYYHFDPTWEYSNTKTAKENRYIYFGLSDQKRFSSLSKECTSGFGALEEVCDVTKANERLTVTGK